MSRSQFETMAAGHGVTFIFQNSDMSKHQAKNVWTGLQRGIQEIQNGNASTLRFEELYRYFSIFSFVLLYFII